MTAAACSLVPAAGCGDDGFPPAGHPQLIGAGR
jgi:hypothetical protein